GTGQVRQHHEWAVHTGAEFLRNGRVGPVLGRVVGFGRTVGQPHVQVEGGKGKDHQTGDGDGDPADRATGRHGFGLGSLLGGGRWFGVACAFTAGKDTRSAPGGEGRGGGQRGRVRGPGA